MSIRYRTPSPPDCTTRRYERHCRLVEEAGQISTVFVGWNSDVEKPASAPTSGQKAAMGQPMTKEHEMTGYQVIMDAQRIALSEAMSARRTTHTEPGHGGRIQQVIAAVKSRFAAGGQ